MSDRLPDNADNVITSSAGTCQKDNNTHCEELGREVGEVGGGMGGDGGREM